MSALLLERSFSDFKSFVAALIGNFGRILSQSAGFRPIEQIHIDIIHPPQYGACIYDSIATAGEIRVYWRADFQSGSRVLKKVF